MENKPTENELREMLWFKVGSVHDLPEARRKETFMQWCMRNQLEPNENSKLDYLIHKHELDLIK